jgi:deazaflavin-dependent oxidoreductase (nitroreductase family)
MSTAITPADQRLRTGFKFLNKYMLLMWRLGLGVYLNQPKTWGNIMVISHTGRVSGLRRRTPLNYAVVDGEVYCVSGFGDVSDWYRNILVNPEVEIWMPGGWWAGIAEEVADPGERLPLLRQVIIGSGFAGRLAGFDPYRMSDTELEAATASYRLVHILRREARTGPGGPGDLAWVWQAATALLLGLLLVSPLVSSKRKKYPR